MAHFVRNRHENILLVIRITLNDEKRLVRSPDRFTNIMRPLNTFASLSILCRSTTSKVSVSIIPPISLSFGRSNNSSFYVLCMDARTFITNTPIKHPLFICFNPHIKLYMSGSAIFTWWVIICLRMNRLDFKPSVTQTVCPL